MSAEHALGGWVIKETVQDRVHIVPIGDGMEHIPTDCPCGPAELEDGLIVHNAADGREAYERGERKAS